MRPDAEFLTITDQGSARWVLVKGNAYGFLRRHDIPAMHSHAAGGWSLHRSRLPDVLAIAEREGVRVKLQHWRADAA